MILRSEIVAKMKANKLRLSTKLENGNYKPKTVKQMKQELKDYLEEKEKEKEISGSGMIASDISALLKKSYNINESRLLNLSLLLTVLVNEIFL